MMTKDARVSFIIVVRNGADHLSRCLADLVEQDFPRERMEVLIVDGDSTDGTRETARDWLAAHPDFTGRLLDNPGRILSCGWNVALAAARYDIILRVDVHARLAPDFIRLNVAAHVAGEMITGGAVLSKTDGDSLLHTLELSRFGAGSAAFRHAGRKGYIDTLGYAAYRRQVFASVGGYDERLVRNQDNEIHHRMRSAGYRFFFDPAIRSSHTPRARLLPFLRQKYLNGLWTARASAVRPGCASLRHLVPFGFTLVLFGAAALALAGVAGLPLIALLVLYAAAAACAAWLAAKDKTPARRAKCTLLPPLFLLTHLSYGCGTSVGLLGLPAWRRRHRGYELPWPISAGASVRAAKGSE